MTAPKIPTLREHVLEAGVEPDVLVSHLAFGHGITSEGDHRELDALHLDAHRAQAWTALHAEVRA